MKKAQTSLEYMLIIVVAIVAVAVVWFFLSSTKTDAIQMGTGTFYELTDLMSDGYF